MLGSHCSQPDAHAGALHRPVLNSLVPRFLMKMHQTVRHGKAGHGEVRPKGFGGHTIGGQDIVQQGDGAQLAFLHITTGHEHMLPHQLGYAFILHNGPANTRACTAADAVPAEEEPGNLWKRQIQKQD